MMLRRSAYDKVGGYAAIRNRVFDDMTLAKLAQAGLRCLVTDGSGHVNCRMYTGMRDIYLGLTKNLFTLFSRSMPVVLAVPLYALGIVFLLFTFFCPILSIAAYLALLLFGIAFPGVIAALTTLGIVLSLATFSIVYRKFRHPYYLVFVYPLNLLLFLGIAASSTASHLTAAHRMEGKATVFSGLTGVVSAATLRDMQNMGLADHAEEILRSSATSGFSAERPSCSRSTIP